MAKMPEPGGQPKISVVIPTYNRDAILRETLSQLTRQTLSADEFEVIVSDDGSSDGTRAVVESFSGRLRIVYRFQEDLGNRASVARNAGARMATAPVLCFIDAGSIPCPDFLRSHLAEHSDDSVRAAVVGYAYGYNPDIRPYPLKAAGDLLRTKNPEDIVAQFGDDPAFFDMRHEQFARCGFDLTSRALPWNFFFTLNCSVRTDDFLGAGGFDESFIGWGGEDLELALRLFRRGLTFRISRDGWVIEWPHERAPAATIMDECRANLDRYIRRTPEPALEMGFALIGVGLPYFSWSDEFQNLNQWSRKVRDLEVADEIAEAARSVPAAGRIAVVGCGGVLPASLRPVIAMDFDRDLLDQVLKSGRHTGYHSIGLRTPLDDHSVDTVIITSRMSGLWERWHDDLTREANRIGAKVVRTFSGR